MVGRFRFSLLTSPRFWFYWQPCTYRSLYRSRITDRCFMKTILLALLACCSVAMAQVPIPSEPSDGAVGLAPNVTLQWRGVGFAAYEVELAPQNNPLDIRVLYAPGVLVVAANLEWSATYVWAVRGLTDSTPGPWSAQQRFTVMPHDGRPIPTSPLLDAEDVPTATMLQWSHSGSGPYEVQIDTLELSDSSPSQTATAQLLSVALLNEQAYLWRVRVQSSAAPSPWSPTFAFTTAQPPLQPLRTPSLIVPPDGSTLDVFEATFSWTPVPEAEGYLLQLLDASNPETPLVEWIGSSTETHVLIPPGYTNLVWRVQAQHASRTSAWSTPFAFALADTSDATVSIPVPLTPFNEQVLHPVEGGIEITWSHEDTTVPCVAEVVWQHTGGLDTLNISSATLSAILPDTIASGTVQWRVKATPWWAESEWSNEMRFTIVPAPLETPLSVQLLYPANNAVSVERNPTLSWSDVPAAQEYHVEVSTVENMDDATARTWTTTAMNIDTLEAATRYWWRARAGNAAGLGDWSQPFSFITSGETTSVENTNGSQTWMVTPNPSNGGAVVLHAAEHVGVLVTIDIVALSGERVATVTMNAGQYSITLPTNGLANGLYVAMINGGGTLRAVPMVITGAQR